MGAESKELTIRVSGELKRIVEDTAKHTGLSVSDIFHAVRNGIRRKRKVTPRKIAKGVTDAGEYFIHVKNCALDGIATQKKFRRTLYLRCMEELAKPPANPPPVFAEVEGRDYNVSEISEYKEF